MKSKLDIFWGQRAQFAMCSDDFFSAILFLAIVTGTGTKGGKLSLCFLFETFYWGSTSIMEDDDYVRRGFGEMRNFSDEEKLLPWSRSALSFTKIIQLGCFSMMPCTKKTDTTLVAIILKPFKTNKETPSTDTLKLYRIVSAPSHVPMSFTSA